MADLDANRQRIALAEPGPRPDVLRVRRPRQPPRCSSATIDDRVREDGAGLIADAAAAAATIVRGPDRGNGRGPRGRRHRGRPRRRDEGGADDPRRRHRLRRRRHDHPIRALPRGRERSVDDRHRPAARARRRRPRRSPPRRIRPPRRLGSPATSPLVDRPPARRRSAHRPTSTPCAPDDDGVRDWEGGGGQPARTNGPAAASSSLAPSSAPAATEMAKPLPSARLDNARPPGSPPSSARPTCGRRRTSLDL